MGREVLYGTAFIPAPSHLGWFKRLLYLLYPSLASIINNCKPLRSTYLIHPPGYQRSVFLSNCTYTPIRQLYSPSTMPHNKDNKDHANNPTKEYQARNTYDHLVRQTGQSNDEEKQNAANQNQSSVDQFKNNVRNYDVNITGDRYGKASNC